MEKLSIYFLNALLLLLVGCADTAPAQRAIDCTDKRVQDSLIKKYIENGAEKLPYYYNDPAWPAWCDSVIAICPNIARAYQLKELPYLKYGDFGKAFALYDTAVALDPKRWTGNLAFLKCIFTKDYEGALVDFQKAEQLVPGGIVMDHTYAFYEGLCHLELGHYKVAEQHLLRDISRQTKGDTTQKPHYNTLLYMGILYYEMGRNDLAKANLLKCLSIYSQLPEASYYLGLIYQREKNSTLQRKYLQAAREAYKKGYRLNEDNMYYSNYPHQVTLFEIEEALQ